MPTQAPGGARAWIDSSTDPESLEAAPELGSFAPFRFPSAPDPIARWAGAAELGSFAHFRAAMDAHDNVDREAAELGSFAHFGADPVPDPGAPPPRAAALGSSENWSRDDMSCTHPTIFMGLGAPGGNDSSFAHFRAEFSRASRPRSCLNE